MSASKKAQQIGFLTALSLVVGTTIGAGIFFKSPGIIKAAQGDLVYVAIAWFISVIGIMCIGICIVELSTASKIDKGPLTWIRNFAPARFSRYSTSFFLFGYLPLIYFALPIYLVKVMTDAIGLANPKFIANPDFILNNGFFTAFLAFIIFVLLVIGSMISARLSKALSWTTTIINFFPLLILPIFAIIAAVSTGGIEGAGGGVINRELFSKDENVKSVITAGKGLTGASKGLVILFAIPALLFSFDGFYSITASRSYLKNPKKMPWIIIIGIITITVLYLFLSISFTIGSATADATSKNLFPKHLMWLQITLNILISSAVLGTINGYIYNVERIYVVSSEEGEFNFLLILDRLIKKMKINLSKNKIGYLVILLFGSISYTIFSPLSFLLSNPIAVEKGLPWFSSTYTYIVADTLTSYTSLLLFVFIGVAILGGFINKYKKQIKTKSVIFYKTAAVIAIIFLLAGSSYYFIQGFVDIFLKIENGKTTWNNFNVGIFTNNVILVMVLLISGIISWVEHKYSHKYHPEVLQKEEHVNSLFDFKKK